MNMDTSNAVLRQHQHTSLIGRVSWIKCAVIVVHIQACVYIELINRAWSQSFDSVAFVGIIENPSA